MGTKEIFIELRTKHGLTQDELAEKLFVTRQAISRWETGKTMPNAETMKLLCTEFKVSLNTLLGQSESPICQSCAMPLHNPEDFGSESDGGVNVEYCQHCYQNGDFTHERNIDEMVESNMRFLDEFNAENGSSFTEEEARTILKDHLATLKRWNKAD